MLKLVEGMLCFLVASDMARFRDFSLNQNLKLFHGSGCTSVNAQLRETASRPRTHGGGSSG